MASWAKLEADFEWRAPLVVLGAGLARRMGPGHAGRSKVLLPIRPKEPGGRLLDGIVGAWLPWASELILVVRQLDADGRVSYSAEQMRRVFQAYLDLWRLCRDHDDREAPGADPL